MQFAPLVSAEYYLFYILQFQFLVHVKLNAFLEKYLVFSLFLLSSVSSLRIVSIF